MTGAVDSIEWVWDRFTPIRSLAKISDGSFSDEEVKLGALKHLSCKDFEQGSHCEPGQCVEPGPWSVPMKWNCLPGHSLKSLLEQKGSEQDMVRLPFTAPVVP